MLRRIGPRHSEAPIGETVTLAALAQDNNGAESGAFQFGSQALPPLQVQSTLSLLGAMRAPRGFFDPGAARMQVRPQ